MDHDSVAAPVDASCLDALLAAIHRNGLGHRTRVIRPERRDPRGQMERAGVPSAVASSLTTTGKPVVVINAPGQVGIATGTFAAAGVESVSTFRTTQSALSALLGYGSGMQTGEPVGGQP